MSRLGRSFVNSPAYAATLHTISESVNLVLTDVDGARSFARVGTVTVSTTETSGDHTEIINGVRSFGEVGDVSIDIEFGPQPQIVLLSGVKSTGQVGQVTISANEDLGWVLITDKASVWRRVEDFRTAEENPGEVDFSIIISSFNGTWKVSTDTEETAQLRSELSISADTLIEGLP